MAKFIVEYSPSILMTLEVEADSAEEALKMMFVGVALPWKAPEPGTDCGGYGNGDVELLRYRLYDPDYYLNKED